MHLYGSTLVYLCMKIMKKELFNVQEYVQDLKRDRSNS